MRLEPLYRVEFAYPEHYHVTAVDSLHLYLAEGRCKGLLSGRFRGANHPRHRPDDVFLPDFQGVIETDDGAVVWFDYRGFGRPRGDGLREIVGTASHQCEREPYSRLNAAACVLVGETRRVDERIAIVLEVAELVWEPLTD
jgi:hypothetical protein